MERLFSIGLHNAAIMAILAILVWSATRIWKSAPVAHLLWLVVLLKLVTPPVVLVDMSGWTQAPTGTVMTAENRVSLGVQHNIGAFHDMEPQGPQSEHSVPIDAEPGLPREVVQEPNVLDAVISRPTQPSHSRFTAPSWGTIRSAIAWIWLTGAILIAVVAAVRIVRFRRILLSLSPAEQRFQAVADDLAKRMGLRRSAMVLQVTSAMAPFVWCFGPRAIVVIPRRLLDTLDSRQLEMVIAHELAHLRRRDHWVRVGELTVSILYWWNPMVWWVRRQLRAAEEECSDAWVAWLFPDESYRYAESLLASAQAVECPSLVLSSPFLNNHTLKRRVEMVLDNRSERSATRRATICLGLFTAATLPMEISIARGQIQEEPKADQTLVQGQKPASQQLDSNPNTDVAAQPPEKPKETEFDRLQGYWAVESCESQVAGWKASEWVVRRWRWRIKGNEITWSREGQEWKANFKIDPDQTPKQIDLTFVDGPHKGQMCPGIYDCDSGATRTLKILIQDPEADVGRPTAFERKAGSQTSLLTFRTHPPIDAARELALFQGTWSWDFSQPWTWPQPIGVGTDGEGRTSEKRWVIDGNQITWVGRDGHRANVKFTIDPFKAPKQIEFTFLDGPHKGQKSIGIYESRGDENHRDLCMTDPGTDAPRPTDYSGGTLLRQSIIVIHRVAPPEKPPAAKRFERFQGVWQMTLCDSMTETFGGTQSEASNWKWTIKGDEILWSRQGRLWKMKFDVDPTKSPKEIDLTYVVGPFRGEKCLGMYEFSDLDGQGLHISIQDPGSDAPRPKDISMRGDVKTSLIFLRPSIPSDTERELGSLQGTWTLRNFDTGRFDRNKDPSSWPLPGGKGPDKSGLGSELRWTINGNEITWTSPSGEEIVASFTIDFSKSPKQIDLSFLSGPHKGKTCPGIYQRDDLDENILWVCIADPGSKSVRPKEFSYQWGEGRSLLSFYPYRSSGDR